MTSSTISSSGAGASTSRLIDQDTNKYASLKQLIVLGLPGSGIDALAEALKTLGYHNIYDVNAAVDKSDRDFPLWLEAATLSDAGKPYSQYDFDKLVARADVLVGAPSSYLAKDIASAYPGVKVVMFKQTPNPAVIQSLLYQVHSKLLSFCDPDYFGTLTKFLKLVCQDKLDYQAVRNVVRPKDLLELDSFDSWKPLCDFLGKAIPDAPVPAMNDYSTLMKLAEHRKRAISNKCKVLLLGFIYGLQVMSVTVACFLTINKEDATAIYLSICLGICMASMTVAYLIAGGYKPEKTDDLTSIATVPEEKKSFKPAVTKDPMYLPPHLRYSKNNQHQGSKQHRNNQYRDNQYRNNRKQGQGRGRQNTHQRGPSRPVTAPTPARRQERQVLAGWGNAEVQAQIRQDDKIKRDERMADAEANKDARVTFDQKHVQTSRDGNRKTVQVDNVQYD